MLLIIPKYMTIISVSLPDTLIEELTAIQKEQGFSGRSEVIRAGLRLLSLETKNTGSITGNITSILILIHNQSDEHVVSDIKHRFEQILKTQIHSHLRDNKCLELFILEGEATDIKEMVRLLQISKKMDIIKLIVA